MYIYSQVAVLRSFLIEFPLVLLGGALVSLDHIRSTGLQRWTRSGLPELASCTSVWNADAIDRRPGCLANDVALATISDRVSYYAVPSSQAHEMH